MNTTAPENTMTLERAILLAKNKMAIYSSCASDHGLHPIGRHAYLSDIEMLRVFLAAIQTPPVTTSQRDIDNLYKQLDNLKDHLVDARNQVTAYERALTPSGETKGAYHGEFSVSIVDSNDEEIEVTIPWGNIKSIMKAIRARAEKRL